MFATFFYKNITTIPWVDHADPSTPPQVSNEIIFILYGAPTVNPKDFHYLDVASPLGIRGDLVHQ